MKALFFAAVFLTLAGLSSAGDQKPAPPKSGNALEARDGDLVVIEGDAKVRLVRRREANVTAIHNPSERWVVVMVDFARNGKPPDGGVDSTFSFHDISSWPLGERWSGAAVVDEYSLGAEMGPTGLGLTTETGLIQVLGQRDDLFRHPAAAAVVSYRGGGRGGGGNRPFAETESRLVVEASNNARNRAAVGGFSSIEAHVGGMPAAAAPAAAAAGQPVRVGGSIKTPMKVVHVDPVVPEQALRAGITGMVIVEATVGIDGSVTDAKILRSIPLLDAAAVEAVRQWKFTPTLLNGVPVPVIMTVTVNFQR